MIMTSFYFFVLRNASINWLQIKGVEFSISINLVKLLKHVVVVQLLRSVRLFATPRTAASQASLSFNISQRCSNSCPLSQWCHPTISSSIVPIYLAFNLFSIRDFSNESSLPIKWPKYWNLNFSISPSSEYSGLISFRSNWFDLLAFQATL